MYPALFSNPPKPIKLRIQADIQARSPGLFTKPQLSAFLRRHTGSYGYLNALVKATHRFDLDGHPGEEVADEHRQAALDELGRRRELHQQRVGLEAQQRANRATLLQEFGATALAPADFAASKGIAAEELDPLLARARREAAEPPPSPDRRPPPRRPPATARNEGGPGASERPAAARREGPRNDPARRNDRGAPGPAPAGDAHPNIAPGAARPERAHVARGDGRGPAPDGGRAPSPSNTEPGRRDGGAAPATPPRRFDEPGRTAGRPGGYADRPPRGSRPEIGTRKARPESRGPGSPAPASARDRRFDVVPSSSQPPTAMAAALAAARAAAAGRSQAPPASAPPAPASTRAPAPTPAAAPAAATAPAATQDSPAPQAQVDRPATPASGDNPEPRS